ncbi:hypothetical protein GXP70_16090 [Paenibacillus lycopersici]|uniref:Alpha/beta hydrolase n=1 Tax=Paenibacillus lycopersici TaxID=2704462 RepID=A0A6C0FW13_9BACL|nr:hypothetical protein [Paenibacillus lycopersici]QHT61326.1 hypothetical protein GXP70_16090 [Paenibacillus lycopersici]
MRTFAPLLSDIRLKWYLLREPKQAGKARMPQALADDIFIKQELIPITNYMPDIAALREYKDKLIFAAGDWTVKHKVWFADVAMKLAQETGSLFVTLPGAHVSFMDKARKWAEILDDCYKKSNK